MDDLQKSIAFRNLIREEIGKFLISKSFTKTYDNENENQENSHNWVFRLAYKEIKLIEIYNRDWRDYIEYFHVAVDGKEMFDVNIKDYETLGLALENFKFKIKELI
ncbi:MAG: hypothetical protein EOO46_21550 [Flavobacterium sp.]|nr:MAG: hypothetical protein EOO46_21550 [Flavobacterium sp.]